MKKLYILGSSGHAKVILDIARSMNIYESIMFLDPLKKKGELINDSLVYGNEDDVLNIHSLNLDHVDFFIGIGDNALREKIYTNLIKKNRNIFFTTLIHPSAIISKYSTIGNGSVIMPGVIINTNSIIGNFSIINTKAAVDHDCTVEDFSSLAPGVTLGGNVSIGKFSSIGLGANIIHGIKIGSEVVVGANSLVMNDLHNNKVYYGSPCKEVRSRNHGDKYL